jgi:hypothetical protein
MEVQLTPDLFVNNKYAVVYGSREALFTIIDEEFAGHNRLGRINRITTLVRKRDQAGKEEWARFCTTVIGISDGTVGVMSGQPELRGKLLNKDNMEQCVVVLYEDE